MRRVTWTEALDRIGAGEDVHAVLDEQSAADQGHFRSVLVDMGPRGVEALTQYDEAMRNNRLGISGAKMLWHSISDPQRRVLLLLSQWPGCLRRRTVRPHGYALDGTPTPICRVQTVRNLCAHELLAWDGGAFSPEAAAVITERGTFTVKWGRS